MAKDGSQPARQDLGYLYVEKRKSGTTNRCCILHTLSLSGLKFFEPDSKLKELTENIIQEQDHICIKI